MRILLTGATGFIGSNLLPFLQNRGHEVLSLTRNPSRPDDLHWDIEAGELDLDPHAQVDAVIHLAGENIAAGRWTKKRKERIMRSRVHGTRLLVRRIGALKNPPRVFLSASGINFYAGGTGEYLDESHPPGKSFLSRVCRAWEGASEPLRKREIRTLFLRLGIVLGNEGGALAKMLPFFRLGLGGAVGTGRQRMSWIAMEDLLEIIQFCLKRENLSGPVNVVSPEVVSNREFTKSLAKTLRRPAFLPLPAAFINLIFGEMGRETLLSDFRICPRKLLDCGYSFRCPELSSALTRLRLRK